MRTIRSLSVRLMKRIVSKNAFLNPKEIRQELSLYYQARESHLYPYKDLYNLYT